MEITEHQLMYEEAQKYCLQLSQEIGEEEALIELSQSHRVIRQQELTSHLGGDSDV